MSRSPSGGCSCGGGGAEGRGHRPATRSPGSSCGGRAAGGPARATHRLAAWPAGRRGSHQRMERVAGKATRSRSGRAWPRELVPEPREAALTVILVSERSGGRAWGK